MGLTTSMYTSLTGLETSGQMLDVVGNNIANVNTLAFKRSTVSFETQISSTLSEASAPNGESGGTNPSQIGLGVQLASINKDWDNGALQLTGQQTDMAIEGEGFFVVNDGDQQLFSRAGNFSLDQQFNLVTPGGARVQGYGVDEDFEVIDGTLTDISIPIGVRTIAEPTTEVRFQGNLNAGGDVAAQGSITTLDALYGTAAGSGGAAAAGATALTSVFNDAGGTPLFATGDIITLTGIEKGSTTIPDTTFEVGAAVPGNPNGVDAFVSTVDELMAAIEDVLGIDTSVSGGVAIDGAGVITITGNAGTENEIDIESANFLVNQATSPTQPFDFTLSQEADGESVHTSFVAYNSLGDAVNVDLTLVLETRDNTGTQWRYYASSADDSDLDTVLSTGTIQFGTDGQLIPGAANTISIDLNDSGAETPQTVDILFSDPFGTVTALFDTASELGAFSSDGSPAGSLEDFSVGEDGTITGVFSSGLLRTLGRIPLATFSNNNGLAEVGANFYRETSNSGTAVIGDAGGSGTGRILGRTIELSNVELAQEFIDLITASTGFSANSRVISTSERLITELLQSVR